MARVLIVDDEFGIAAALADALGDDGYRTDIAHDGLSGLERMEAERPDLVILDYMMPVVDGAETLRRMRANPNLASIPVIMISAIPRDMNDEAPEAAAYLTKPFPLVKLLDLVERLLSK